MLSVPLRFVVKDGSVRRGEPVTVGLPWPRGAVRDERCFRLIGPDGERPLQSRTLDRWGDGSIRWCLFDLNADVDAANPAFRIEVGEYHDAVAMPMPALRDAALAIVQDGLILDVMNDLKDLNHRVVRQDIDAHLQVESGSTTFTALEQGPVRFRWSFRRAAANGLEIFGVVDLFAGNNTARYQLTIRNPCPASHPGGTWNLGNGGSQYLSRFAVICGRVANGVVRYSAEPQQELRSHHGSFRLFQQASGGENWRSPNHMDRHRKIVHDANGYQIDCQTTGLRATPVLTLESGDMFLGVAMPHFWENFPKAMQVSEDGTLTLELFPGETELQGGEQKTHTFSIAFGKDSIAAESMAWSRSPLLGLAEPEWYAASGAIPYLTPSCHDRNRAYLALVEQAVEGPDSFYHKREKIDEYGWRNFGDVYADHEAVRHTGPEPLVSHYNNQYDCVAGFAYQFFRSGDPRWWDLHTTCASHTADIDIYHTDGDKPAYNRGLFWHTYHYAAADTSTHRSYPRALTQGPVDSLTAQMENLGDTAAKLQSAYAVGGGPSASHCYSTGLMLAYFLTGNPLYHESVLDLAGHIMRMEDPAGTPFRFLSREYTGLASDSQAGYHGPGRASGNAVSVLLDGHRLTGDHRYLEMAERLIRRVCGPTQNLSALNLLNAEERWFYTVHLQAVGKYLDHKRDLGQLEREFAHARLTLLHYGRWMAEHERPVLDTPEQLQYPTETWAAQEMRKVEVFQYAALHTNGPERERYLERAAWFFRYVEQTLTSFPTRSLARPVVLMLSFGWSHAWWQNQPEVSKPIAMPDIRPEDFGDWRMFTPQKIIAIRRAKRIVVAAVATGVLLSGLLFWPIMMR